MASPAPGQLIGIVVTIVGLSLSALFVLADMIGVGDAYQFGSLQMAGTALGAIVAAGGFVVYRTGKHAESRLTNHCQQNCCRSDFPPSASQYAAVSW